MPESLQIHDTGFRDTRNQYNCFPNFEENDVNEVMERRYQNAMCCHVILKNGAYRFCGVTYGTRRSNGPFDLYGDYTCFCGRHMNQMQELESNDENRRRYVEKVKQIMYDEIDLTKRDSFSEAKTNFDCPLMDHKIKSIDDVVFYPCCNFKMNNDHISCFECLKKIKNKKCPWCRSKLPKTKQGIDQQIVRNQIKALNDKL